jgi:hypothetical protein
MREAERRHLDRGPVIIKSMHGYPHHAYGIRYVEHAEGHADKMFAAVCQPGGHRFKEARRTIQIRAIKGVAENQKSEGTGSHSRSRWDVLMNRKFILAILLVAAVPALAQAQKPRVTKDDAQKVVTIITGDKAKTQTYCEIQNLGEQMERAYEKRNLKLVDELLQKIDALEETLGPEYLALIEGLDLIDPEKDKLGAEFMSIFGALDKLCAR